MQKDRRTFLKFAAIGVVGVGMLPLVGCPSTTQGWVETLETDMPTISQIVGTTLSVVATAYGAGVITPAIQTSVQLAFGLVSTGLATVDQVLTDYKNNPNATTAQKVQIAVQDTFQQASAILAIVIPDANTEAVVNAAVTSVTSVLGAILSLFPASTVSVSRRMIKPVVLPKRKDLIQNFNSVLVASGYSGHRLT